MLHLAAKAFFPSRPPFPLLHVDTTWKFQAMYEMRERMAQRARLRPHRAQEPRGRRRRASTPSTTAPCTPTCGRPQGLKQALDKHGFDAAFGGARRDEEKSRAKERIVSLRSAHHGWDPKAQRPELWKLYNTRLSPGESIRVFPLSNWTELDIWQYIHLENIPIVPLYFAARAAGGGARRHADHGRRRPHALPPRRDPDDAQGPVPHPRLLSADAAPSRARPTPCPRSSRRCSLTTTSERQGRAIDHDAGASMEKKKREGYF